MDKINMWELKPCINFYIHHENLATFVKPFTLVPEWTVMVVRSGSFYYEWEGVKGDISDESLFFCPPDVHLSRKIITPLTFDYMRLEWFYPDGTSANKNSHIPVGKVNITNTKRLFSDLTYLQALAERNDAFSHYWMSFMFSDIWNLYCADVCSINPSFDMDSEDKLMNKARELIKEHAYEKIHLRKIAHTIGLSSVQFTRRFKTAFGVNPLAYIAALRMQRVRRFLVETDFTLREIAERSGYQNEYYLSKVFTITNGMNPSKYRKTYQL